ARKHNKQVNNKTKEKALHHNKINSRDSLIKVSMHLRQTVVPKKRKVRLLIKSKDQDLNSKERNIIIQATGIRINQIPNNLKNLHRINHVYSGKRSIKSIWHTESCQ